MSHLRSRKPNGTTDDSTATPLPSEKVVVPSVPKQIGGAVWAMLFPYRPTKTQLALRIICFLLVGTFLITTQLYLFGYECLPAYLSTFILPESFINEYEGYEIPDSAPPVSQCERIEEIPTADHFDHFYYQPSKPVIIAPPGGFSSMGWKTDSWDLEYLTK